MKYIRSWEEFPYDTDDVIENIDSILYDYGIFISLERDDYLLLIDELLELAEQTEISEAVRWASLQLICGHNSDSDYRIPGFC